MVISGAAGSGRARIGRHDSNPSVTNGPSEAQRRAVSAGSIPDPRNTDNKAAPDPDRGDTYRPEPYCAVTIVCGRRRLDLALPTTVCCSDLLPGLLRLMLPDDATADPWALIPIGRGPLTGSENLAEAGVLAGDLLVLEQRAKYQQSGSAMVTTRDRIEDVMDVQQRFWGPRTARGFAHWAALSTAAALLLPAAKLPFGPGTAVMSATVAVIVAMIAVLAGRRSENTCAALGLVLGCGWAALAGATAFRGWAAGMSLPGVGVGGATLTVAAGSALLLAACAAVSYPAALVHTTALLVVGTVCLGLVIAVSAGAQMMNAASVTALLAVLLLGALPRSALATGGLTGSDPGRDCADLERRISRADRVLVGGLIGVSIVAAGGAIPGALTNAGGPRVLAVGIGLLLLLRSRAYSQSRHVLAPRVAGLLVFGVLWLGVYRDSTVSPSVLIIGAAVAVAAWAIAADVLRRAPSPVGLARRGRLLDAAEQLLVVALIVLTCWMVVLADWVTSVIS